MIGITSGVARQRSNSTQPPCRRGTRQRQRVMCNANADPHLYLGHQVFRAHVVRSRCNCTVRGVRGAGAGFATCTRGVGCGTTGKDEDAEVGSKGVGQDSLGAARELSTTNTLCVMKTKGGGHRERQGGGRIMQGIHLAANVLVALSAVDI